MGAAETLRASSRTLIAGARMVRDAGSHARLHRGNLRNLRRAAFRARFQTANGFRVEIDSQEPVVAAAILRPHRAFFGGHRENRLLYLVEPGEKGNVHEFSRISVFRLGNCAIQEAEQRDDLGSSVAGGSNFQVNPCRSEDRRYKTLRRSERICQRLQKAEIDQPVRHKLHRQRYQQQTHHARQDADSRLAHVLLHASCGAENQE